MHKVPRCLTYLRTRLASLAGVSLSARHSYRLPMSRILSLTSTGKLGVEDAKPLLKSACPGYMPVIRFETYQIPSAFTDFDGYKDQVRTTPLLDILSVRVQSSEECQNEKRSFEIYGNIQLIDVEQNHSYDVFCRTSDNPQTVLSGSHLLLANPKGICSYLYVPSVPSLKMCVDLKDAAANGEVIAKGDFDLHLFDHHKDGLHERVVTQLVGGGCDGNFASLKYATLPHAVLATVNLTFTKLHLATGSDDDHDHDQPSHALIYGCISTTSKVRQGDNISSVLLNKTPCEPLMLKVGEPIQLTRPILAVPAYSSFEINLDLWDYRTKQPISRGVILTNIQAQDGEWLDWPMRQRSEFGHTNHILVEVRWDNALVPQIEPDEQSLSALSYRGSLVAKDWLLTSSSSPMRPSSTGSPMLEVFSITISPYSDANSCLCGKIKVYDNKVGNTGNPIVMFEHTESDAVMLTSDMKISSLKWPICPFELGYFSMYLDLSDGKGREVSCGAIDWYDHDVCNYSTSWYGKLVSSVIRGKHGYATVHYAIFRNAVHADVTAEFKPNNSCRGHQYMVIGNITARYSCFTYSSDLEKKFFHSSLMTKNHKAMMFGDGGVLELEKRAVAVPVDSLLILGMDLHVGIMGRTTEGTLFSKHYGSLISVVEFKFDVGNQVSTKTLAGEGFDIQVAVTWKEVIHNERSIRYETLQSDLLSRCLAV